MDFMQHKTSDKRYSEDASINDVFEALLKINSLGKLLKFVSKDIGRLPDRQPKKLNKFGKTINR